MISYNNLAPPHTWENKDQIIEFLEGFRHNEMRGLALTFLFFVALFYFSKHFDQS